MRYVASLCLFAALAIATGCESKTHADTPPEAIETPELAVFMGAMQRYSHKLGYAVQAKNQRLAEFYLHEIEETLEEIEAKVPEHDGFKIPPLVRTIVKPAAKALDEAIDAGKWDAATGAYATMIASCNRCHTAMQHEFLKITVPTGTPPYNQEF